MCSEMQEEELEVLKSIYDGDENFKEINITTFQYKYGEDGSQQSFLLEVNWPETYPDSLPVINLNAFYNKHLGNSVKQQIQGKLLKEAESYLGSAMTYTLIEWVKEHFDDLLVNHTLHREPLYPVNQIGNLDIEEKVDTSSKENKERRVALTKAQKRRQWDRMDGKGEKARGFDWVDVIKHLSQTGGSQPA